MRPTPLSTKVGTDSGSSSRCASVDQRNPSNHLIPREGSDGSEVTTLPIVVLPFDDRQVVDRQRGRRGKVGPNLSRGRQARGVRQISTFQTKPECRRRDD